MHIRATVTGKPLSSVLGITQTEWASLGNLLRARIVLRTRMTGVDADGAAFEPYSEGYAKYKAKYGASPRVNLTGAGPLKRSGGAQRMLDAIVVEAQATTNPRTLLKFGLSGKDEIARYHMGEGRVERAFFAFSDEDLDFIHRWAQQKLAGKR